MDLEMFRRRFPERRLRVDGLTWGAIDTGGREGGPALVMLPGTLGTAAIFWNQIIALRSRARIVALTYPVTSDIGRLAHGVAQVLDRLGIRRTNMVGSSLGGYLAQRFASLHPSRVATLFIGNSLADPALTRRNVDGIVGELARASPITHQRTVLGSVRSWPEPEPAVADLKRLLIESGTRYLGPRALKARVLAAQLGPVVPPLALPHRRVVVVDCADDPLLRRAVLDDVVHRYPGATHYRLSVGGHYPYILRPGRYSQILARHLT